MVTPAWDAGSSGSLRRLEHQQHHQGPIQSVASTPSARISQTTPIQDPVVASVSLKPGDAGLVSSLWMVIFLLHLLAVLALIIFLAVRGQVNKRSDFRPAFWYLPILAATGCSAIAAAVWLLVVLRWPSRAVKAAFWFAPLLTLALGILLIYAETAVSLAFGVIGLVLSLGLSLYACWVRPRLPHANEIMASSLPGTHGVAGRMAAFVAIALAVGFIWSSIWSLGAGGVAAARPRFSVVYIVLLLFNLTWTMEVIRNILTVTIAGFAYMRLGRGVNIDPGEAWRNAWTTSLGNVCLGSAIVPPIVALRGAARSVSLVSGDADEFLFSCTACFMGAADRLIELGNRWGFVHVGVYAKGFVAASEDTWKLFLLHRMEPVIDLDVTSSFCFLSGVAGGSLSALLGGIWAAAAAKEKAYAADVTLYSFVIGYFMNRITMSWPQACVSALHVAYAENPRLQQHLVAPITDRIQSLAGSAGHNLKPPQGTENSQVPTP
ncbi:unnamed protein product [Spirodela intermedia]|uniref:Choline transporter-like protein n=1 Tax=Spirodela intermedia TaxID=51605 RepID=A0A7I8KCZ9_SPIIN|nr:unnamed protein product [Spirodela intermedia]